MMSLLLLLGGCGSEDTTQQALDFRQGLQGCRFFAVVTADYETRTCQFSLDCSCQPDGTTSVTVTEPETIAEISATVTDGGRTVSFDDLSLEFGTLGTDKIAPVSGPAVLYDCWTSAYIDSAGSEADKTLVVYRQGYEREELVVRCWFDPQTGLPTDAEICDGENVILTMTLSDFSKV